MKKTSGQKFKYIATFGGGLGEDVWDGEMEVTANDFFNAVEIFKERMDESGDTIGVTYDVFDFSLADD